jgi:hypothetical protein
MLVPLAKADESCRGLLEELRAHLFQGKVRIQHTTNYKTSSQAFVGVSADCWLDRMPGGSFSGSGINCKRQINRHGQRPALEPIGYAISSDGKLTFVQSQNRYGPYEMNCLGGKFALVNTGDSIETFIFLKL